MPYLTHKSQILQLFANVLTDFLRVTKVINLKLLARIVLHLFKFLLRLSSMHAPGDRQLLNPEHFQL